jgi:hypothetical protein
VAVAAWAAGAGPTTVTAAATAAASVMATLGELRFMVVGPFVPPSGQGPGPTGGPSRDGPSMPAGQELDDQRYLQTFRVC